MISISLKTDRRTLTRVEVNSIRRGEGDNLLIVGADAFGDLITEDTPLAMLIDDETRVSVGAGSIRVLKLFCGTGQDLSMSSEHGDDGKLQVFCGIGDARNLVEDVKLGDILAPDQRRFLARVAMPSAAKP
jgi:hypothetical protein